MSSPAKTALLVVRTNVVRDPRVMRQLDWLTSEGWRVDTLGLGEKPPGQDGDHFVVADWRKSRLRDALSYLLPARRRFRLRAEDRFPGEVTRRVRDKEYDLILFNDIQLLGWLSNRETFPPNDAPAHIHLDLHEYFSPQLPKTTRGRALLNGYYRWTRAFIDHPMIDSRTVAAGMGRQYAAEFGIPEPALVRNCPPYADLAPSAVNPERIELIHHGVAAWRRGFKEMIDAMRFVDDRFVLTFMLAGNQQTIAEVKAYASELGDRIRFAPAVPMAALSREVNRFDAEVMFFPKSGGHGGYGLPNKLFEAIQGRLALVIGPTPPMVGLVKEARNGVITRDWSPESLAEAINSLTSERISQMKAASHRIAPQHTAEAEKAAFFAGLNNSEFA